MAYTPPSSCGEILFEITGTYIVPGCGQVNFDFVGTAQLAIDSDNVVINWSIQDDVKVEILQDIISESISISTKILDSLVRGTEGYHLPTGGSSDIKAIFYQNGKKIDTHKSIPWNKPTDIAIQKEISRNIKPKETQNDIVSGWKSMDYRDHTVTKVWGTADDYSTSYYSRWISLFNIDNGYLHRYEEGAKLTIKDVNVRWEAPVAKDMSTTVGYDTSKTVDEFIVIPWNAPGAKDSHNTAAWGPFSYFKLCGGLKYTAPPCCDIRFKLPGEYELMPGICKEIHFVIDNYSSDPRCPYRHYHTGVRDNYLPVVIVDNQILYPSGREAYYMANIVLVEELITHAPIQVLAVTASIDINSWLWSFSVTVADKCYLDLIKPVDGVMGHIKININGYVWYCTVEGWSESRTFGSQSWTITGRSPSMMFGEPISKSFSGSVATGKQGQQIIEEIIAAKQIPQYWPTTFGSWSADFTAYTNTQTGFLPYVNWYIPENTVSYSSTSEIEVIKSLVEAIGGFVNTSPDSNELIVKPRYAYQPWNWNASNGNINWKAMNESQFLEISRSNELKSYYQGVYVVGESVGGSNDGTGSDGSNTAIAAEIRRSEYSQSAANYAPMVTNPYITSSKAALEAGRMVLADTGEWIKHSLRIPSLCPNSTQFGLFACGDMVSINERSVPWFGQVTGVSVTVANAGAGFAVEQTIEVEQYNGD